MMFMNQWDIEDARAQFSDDPVMDAATATLYNLMTWTNQNSDGWPYWSKPCQAAKNLMTFIQSEQRRQRDSWHEEVDENAHKAAYKKSLAAIKAFRTRQGATFEIVTV